ncbi:hypothetical protein HZY97_00815 [Sphingomonas sp. R-74633]|uniref:hypothetical protein n=1 Tax=Sphingomonas sp. R-74633 TaxID=2751188 RepID=UPI0015D16127|nr:hypothetical protein [Sphingomonas sp. R-74633]NYT39286.1 hypothetical protein [Sphingomonas sp. R-74633]
MTVAGAATLAGEILEAYEAIRKGRQNRDLRDEWAEFWGTQYGTGEFWFAYAQFAAKLDDLRSQIEESVKDERSKELFLGALRRMRASYDVIYLQNNVSNIAQLDETFNIIHLASNVLPMNTRSNIETVTVEAVAAQIAELIDGIEGADFDGQLARFLRGQLTFLHWAVENYPSLGIAGLSKAYGMVASEFARAWSNRAEGDEVKEKWWEKTRKGLKLVGEGVIWGEKVAAGAEKLLTHADDIAGIIS